MTGELFVLFVFGALLMVFGQALTFRAYHKLWGRAKLLRLEVLNLRSLLIDTVSDEQCWYDRNGYCQTHYVEDLVPDEACPYGEVQRLVKRWTR